MDKKQMDETAEKRRGKREPERKRPEKAVEGREAKAEEPQWIDAVELVEFDLL